MLRVMDLSLSEFSDICIQVKCRQGDPDNVSWTISKKEIDSNSVIICVSILEKIDESQDEYNLVIVGFIPTRLIEVKNNISIGIHDILYINGLMFCLSKLKLGSRQEYLCENDSEILEDNMIWGHALEKLNKLSKALLTEHATLGFINRQEAKILIRKDSILRLIQSKIPDLEWAFEAVLNRKVQVTVEVLTTAFAEKLILKWMQLYFKSRMESDMKQVLRNEPSSNAVAQECRNALDLPCEASTFDIAWRNAAAAMSQEQESKRSR
jgi:hypothetical protein